MMGVTDYIANRIAELLAPDIARNIISGIAEFESHCFPMPVRCKAKHWMRRGEERIDMNALFPEDSDGY